MNLSLNTAVVNVTLVVTETSDLFLSHRANALACAQCGMIVAIEICETGRFIWQQIEPVNAPATAA